MEAKFTDYDSHETIYGYPVKQVSIELQPTQVGDNPATLTPDQFTPDFVALNFPNEVEEKPIAENPLVTVKTKEEAAREAREFRESLHVLEITPPSQAPWIGVAAVRHWMAQPDVVAVAINDGVTCPNRRF